MTKEIKKNFKQEFPQIKENVLLKHHASFKFGGPADLYFETSSIGELQKIIELALDKRVDFFILGFGKNVIFADDGFRGLIIKLKFNTIKLISNDIIEAEAGASLAEIINFAHLNGLVGLESLAGIPSSLGGAIFGNAGAYKKTIGDFVVEIKTLIFDKIKKNVSTRNFTNQEFKFSYRGSLAKSAKNLIILSAKIKLKQAPLEKAKQEMREIIVKRQNNQSWDLPNAGCVFKNPPGKNAGELIEKCGFKGKVAGGLKVSERHANFIVNFNHGTSADYMALTKQIKESVKKKFNIELSEENIVVGRRLF